MERTGVRLPLFLFLLLAISVLAQTPLLRAGGVQQASPLWVLLIMWSPGLAAILSKLALDRSLKGMGWGWGRCRYQLVGYLIPPVTAGAVYGTVWLARLAPLKADEYGALVARELGHADAFSIPVAVVLLASVGFLADCLAVLGEEIGWRGFLFPELAERSGPLVASMLTGAIWAVWHIPGIVWGGYNSGGSTAVSILCFSWMIVAISVIAGWLRIITGSLWSGVVLHASHNLFIQAVFDPLTTRNDASRWLTTEWGVGLAGAYSVIALVLILRRFRISRTDGMKRHEGIGGSLRPRGAQPGVGPSLCEGRDASEGPVSPMGGRGAPGTKP